MYNFLILKHLANFGSLIAKCFCRAPEIDISELESLFSANIDASGGSKAGVRRGTNINKPEKVQLVRYKLEYM